MNVIELKRVIENEIDIEYSISILFSDISNENGLSEYNTRIRSFVLDLPGIYIIENLDNLEVWYIGMAGKVNQQGNLGNHTLRKRLRASRYKDPLTGRDIATNRYLLDNMRSKNCNQINIHLIHLREGNVPTYVEALLLNAFLQTNRILPIVNNSF